ncbi:MAG: hypothetical protein JEZ02_00815 [Desulfatibacillum sp.]|nr:hypothetical protein [Desulfatibacillum sp.]
MPANHYKYEFVDFDGATYVKAKYPVIIFNGMQLPLGAISIDYCASGNFFEDIDDAMSLWFWRFTICVGYYAKSEESRVVIHHADMLKSLILGDKERVREIITGKSSSSDEADQTLVWWLDTLDIMLESAANTSMSFWTGILDIATAKSRGY